MARKILLFVLIMTTLIVCSSCWDSMDINDKGIATIIVIDKLEDEYYFYANIPNIEGDQRSSNGTEGQRSQVSAVFGKGKTFIEAREDLDNKLDKPLFLGAVRVLVMTDNMLKEDFEQYMFRVQSLSEYRKTVIVVSTTEDPKTLLDVQPENNISVGYAIEGTMETLKSNGAAIATTSSEVLEWIYSDNDCFVIPNFNVRDENVALTGYSVLQDNEYKGLIEYEESNGLVCFLNDNAKKLYVVPFGENTASVLATLKKKEIDPQLEENGVSFDIRFELDAIVKYLDDNIKMSEDDLSQIKSKLEEMILEDVIFTIEQAKFEFGAEYLGFDDAFRISYPDKYKEVVCTEEFIKSKIYVSVYVNLKQGGLMRLEEE